MLRLIIFPFLLVIFITNGQAQATDSLHLSRKAQEKLIDKAVRIKDDDTALKAIDELFKSNQITDKCSLSELYAARAETIYESYWNHGGSSNDDMEDKVRLNMIPLVLADFQKAIDADPRCKPINCKLRMEFLSTQGRETDPLYIQDLAYLKEHGYKEDVFSLGLSAGYTRGKSDMLGLELAAMSILSPSCNLRNTDPDNGKKVFLGHYHSMGAKFLILGYNQNLNLPSTHEFTISPLQWANPVLIDITKIGYTASPLYKSNSWFYRPQIGIGWNWISVGYAYNFVFSKSDRSQADTHMIFIKLSYPLLKYNLDEKSDKHPH
jgi:hypothetical protein